MPRVLQSFEGSRRDAEGGMDGQDLESFFLLLLTDLNCQAII